MDTETIYCDFCSNPIDDLNDVYMYNEEKFCEDCYYEIRGSLEAE